MLEVRSISRSYGDLKAVDEVSFTVTKGEIVGLLGPNGAGKTTIMKMLSGYLEPDSGSILFNNARVEHEPAVVQRELGYLPENLPVYPELSVASYLEYAAELKGLTGEDKRHAIRRVIEATELGSRLLSPISTLSRGMKQRVGVAQAIIGGPSLLILDEPTNGLDPAQTEQMRAVIRNLSETATVILSTHIMQEVEAMCDRALIIREGRLAVDTRLDELNNGNRILLSSSAAQADIRSALAHIDQLADVKTSQRPRAINSPTYKNAPAFNNFVLLMNPSTNLHETIAQCATALVGSGVPVMGLQVDNQNLQSLFLEVNSSSGHLERRQTENNGDVEHVA